MDTPQVLLEHYLKQLRLPTMLREYPKLAEQCAKESATFEQFLLRLVEQEMLDRERRATERRIKAARFPVSKSLETYDFLALPSLNKKLVVELARCEWIGRRENVLALGNSGTGKTHIGLALGLAACQQGFRVRFTTAAALESGMTPDTRFPNPLVLDLPQTTNVLQNFGGEHCLGGVPTLTLAQALTVSCNVVFGEIGLRLGAAKLVAQAKKLGLFAAGSATQKYMQAIQDQQEVMGAIADMTIETYAMESAVLRAQKLVESKGEKEATLAIAMTRVYLTQAMEKIEAAAKRVIAAVAEGDMLRTQLAILRRLAKYEPFNTIELRQKIAQRAIEVGKYSLA